MAFFVPPEREALRTRLKKAVVHPVRLLNKGKSPVYEPEHPYDQTLANERNAILSAGRQE